MPLKTTKSVGRTFEHNKGWYQIHKKKKLEPHIGLEEEQWVSSA